MLLCFGAAVVASGLVLRGNKSDLCIQRSNAAQCRGRSCQMSCDARIISPIASFLAFEDNADGSLFTGRSPVIHQWGLVI